VQKKSSKIGDIESKPKENGSKANDTQVGLSQDIDDISSDTANESHITIELQEPADRKKAEIVLLQNHRLAAIGELTAGMAHEINNPLFGIMNYAELVKASIDEGVIIKPKSEEYGFIQGIIDEAQRISKIISNISEFSRKAESKEFTAANIGDIFNRVEKILAFQIRQAHVKIEKSIASDIPKIMLQEFRIQQGLFNLMLNSIQAFEKIQDRHHLIKISVDIDKATTPHFLFITIWDNGEGINSENIVKIFTPFFTTRRATKGTGLGLYTVFNIITDLNGTIYCESKLNEFTKFTIKIPIQYPND